MFSQQTVYSIVVNSLTNREKQSIEYLYRPLIGSKAFTFYQFLRSEIEFNAKVKPTALTFSRLYQFLNFSNKDLEQSLHQLVKYKLLQYQQNAQQGYRFILQKPLLFLEFSKSAFFNDYRQLVAPDNLESIYFLFETANSCDPQPTNSPLLTFLNSLQCLKDYKLKIRDLNLLTNLHKQQKMSLEMIKILLEFCFFKTGTFQSNYLLKIVETLKQNDIHTKLKKTKSYLCKIYQEMSLEHLERLNSPVPD